MGRHEHTNQATLDAISGTVGDMLKSDNLSGLADAATARSNLGLGTAAVEAATAFATAAAGFQSATAAGATPVDNDVSTWPATSSGIVVGTGGRIWLAHKNPTDVYFVELSAN